MRREEGGGSLKVAGRSVVASSFRTAEWDSEVVGGGPDMVPTNTCYSY